MCHFLIFFADFVKKYDFLLNLWHFLLYFFVFIMYNEYMNKCSYKEVIMQREDVIITRVLLEGYKHLDRLYEALGKSIECLVNSGYNSGYIGTTTLIYDKIIEYNYRREGIYNLKAIVNQTLMELSPQNRELLTLHFIEQKEFGEIKDILGVSLRTIFRYYDRALQSFSLSLKKTGFPESRIEAEFGDEPFYIRMKKKVLGTLKVNIERGLRKNTELETDKDCSRIANEKENDGVKQIVNNNSIVYKKSISERTSVFN